MSSWGLLVVIFISLAYLVNSQRPRDPYYRDRRPDPYYPAPPPPPPPANNNTSGVCKKHKFQCFLEPSFDPKIVGQNMGYLRCEVTEAGTGAAADTSRWTQCSICCEAWGLSRRRPNEDIASYVYHNADEEEYQCICCERKCKDKDRRRSSSEE